MKTELIVEVSSSHGGERAWQDRFIDNAAAAKAEYVKFQSYQTAHLSLSDPQYAWLQKAELSDADHERLIRRCESAGIQFLTTVYTADRVPFLASLGLPAIKIGSGEAMDLPLLEAVAAHPWKVYLSTGLVTETNLERCRRIFALAPVTFLHCVSRYPTPVGHVNMGRMGWLVSKTLRPVGYSDHTTENYAAWMAMVLRAACVEVHHSDPSAPRCQPWDKSAFDLTWLAEMRDTIAAMKAHRPMAWYHGEERLYVGRWQVGV